MRITDKLLLIFDIDGTLADRDTNELLPGVRTWFERNAKDFQIALVTNQGGVGLRHWMESGGFGEPEKFPTEEKAYEHIDAVNKALPGGPYSSYVCFAYQSKKTGKWGPVPCPDCEYPEWDAQNRKPNPGMIFQAIKDAGTTRDKTAMIGDGDEDRAAAANAGIAYFDANDVFVDAAWAEINA